MPRRVSQLVVVAILAAVVLGAVLFVLLPGPTKTVQARFERAVGLYTGSDVRLHGIKIGTITKVTPDGDGVVVRMRYQKKIKLPAYPDDAKVVRAAIIPPSLVSDRYVQLADFDSCTTGCPVLASGAAIPMNQTAAPVELDDIYAALDKLNVALGPQGANSTLARVAKGPLSDLIDVGAANLDGNGTALGNTVTDLSKAVRTLAAGREDLFGTVKNLQVFTDALVANDAQVRAFNTQLDQVSAALADERGSLAAALKNLTAALRDIAGFIQANGDAIHTDVGELKDVVGVLNKQKAALNEVLAVAPVALENLNHTYNAQVRHPGHPGQPRWPGQPAGPGGDLLGAERDQEPAGQRHHRRHLRGHRQGDRRPAAARWDARPATGRAASAGRSVMARVLTGRLARVLAPALAGVLTLSGCGFHGLYSAPLPGGADLGSHPYRVLVDFADVLDLVPQSSVKVNDVTVGKVESVSLVGWQARAQVVVNGDVRLPANAYARVRQTSLLGEKFVSLSYPPDGEVSDPVSLAQAPHPGYAYPHIGIGRTGSTPELEAVLGALSLLLNGGGLEQIKTITHELNQALTGHAGRRPQPADPGHRAHHQPELPEGPDPQGHRQPRRAGPHPQHPEAGAGRRAGHHAAGGEDPRRREDAVRYPAQEPGQPQCGRGAGDRRLPGQLRLGAAEPGPGDDPAHPGRRGAAEVAGTAGHLPVPAHLRQRHPRRLHQPLPDRRPQPLRPAGQPAHPAEAPGGERAAATGGLPTLGGDQP